MSSEQLAAIAGIVLSLVFFYVPGLKDWYEKQTSQIKSLVMLGSLVLVAGGAFGLACLKWVEVAVTCDTAGALGLVKALIAAIVANQATYVIFRKIA